MKLEQLESMWTKVGLILLIDLSWEWSYCWIWFGHFLSFGCRTLNLDLRPRVLSGLPSLMMCLCALESPALWPPPDAIPVCSPRSTRQQTWSHGVHSSQSASFSSPGWDLWSNWSLVSCPLPRNADDSGMVQLHLCWSVRNPKHPNWIHT